jgi:hypothetical protein
LRLYSIKVDAASLQHYCFSLWNNEQPQNFASLAYVIANNPFWQKTTATMLVVRSYPLPVLGVIGSFTHAEEVWLSQLGKGLNSLLARVHYVTYAAAEESCAILAEKLVARFGRQELKSFQFVAIPRGGMIVLGMLSYLISATHDQLQFPPSNNAPLIVVDDCAYTGARFGQFLKNRQSEQVVFAHLYSHPDLRSAIRKNEPSVIDCISSHDLSDYGEETLGDQYESWRESWLGWLSDMSRYWLGHVDYVCFPWGEPDHSSWNLALGVGEKQCYIIPPEFCLKNKTRIADMPLPVQIQPEGVGPLAPSGRTIFGVLPDFVLIGDFESQQSFILRDVAADIWQGVVAHGNVDAVVLTLLEKYDIDPSTLRHDVNDFVENLLYRGLLEYR